MIKEGDVISPKKLGSCVAPPVRKVGWRVPYSSGKYIGSRAYYAQLKDSKKGVEEGAS